MKGVTMTNVAREEVRERYAEAATSLAAGCGCGCDCESIGCCGDEETTKFGQGLDMTDEMLSLAQENARKAGATNVHFLKGIIEDIPLASDSVDVVISNCVVNLSPEKDRVLGEIARVLRSGGRIGISDVVAEDRLSAADRAERGSHVGCIAGALSVSEYRDGLAAAGLVDIDVELTHVVADGMHGAIVRASKPA
jgi:ubiquinone/menaquinone biosynthesis C-methylase UbiE